MKHFVLPRSVIELRVTPHSSGGHNNACILIYSRASPSCTTSFNRHPPYPDTQTIHYDENEQHIICTPHHKLYSILPRVLRKIQNTVLLVDDPFFPFLPQPPTVPFPSPPLLFSHYAFLLNGASVRLYTPLSSSSAYSYSVHFPLDLLCACSSPLLCNSIQSTHVRSFSDFSAKPIPSVRRVCYCK